MKIMKCAICGTNKDTQVLYKESIHFEDINTKTFSARRIPEKVHYQLLRCNTCGLIISSPILSTDKIQLLYRKSKLTYKEEIPSLKKTYGFYLKSALKYLPKKPKLLEIGGGNGFFLEEAKERGVEDFWGVEPSHDAINMARNDIKKRMIEGFFPTAKIKTNSLDIICIFQTLDHIIDPNTFLQECFKVLKKDGIILTILHDTDGLSVKLLGESSPIFDIEHIYLFNKTNLKQIFEKNGFKTVSVFDVKNTYPLRYWTRMFPLPKALKNLVMNLLKILGLDGWSIPLKAGNIGIIVRRHVK